MGEDWVGDERVRRETIQPPPRGATLDAHYHYRYDESPRHVHWELTRACDLQCEHCRVGALSGPHPDELRTQEACRMLESLAQAEPKPHVLFTGGDPLRRRDLWVLLSYAQRLGLHTSLAPSATGRLTERTMKELRAHGVRAIALGLDGSTPFAHDSLQGTYGVFEQTLRAARLATDEGLPLQINTLVTGSNYHELPGILKLVSSIGAMRWSLFFLVRTGGSRDLPAVDAHRAEGLLKWAAEIDEDGLLVSTTGAPHFRRIALALERRATGLGIREGNGVMFISHAGHVMPSGFMPISVGNVRRTDPLELYRDSDLFRALRHPAGFAGRCGRCQFRDVCGGSRARAYAETGDPLGEDPLCAYDPPARPSVSSVPPPA